MNRSEKIIERMIHSTMAKNAKHLADMLGISPQKITTWRSRNTIPYKECLDISQKNRTSIEWLLTGKRTGNSDNVYDIVLMYAKEIATNKYVLISPDAMAHLIQTWYLVSLKMEINNDFIEQTLKIYLKKK